MTYYMNEVGEVYRSDTGPMDLLQGGPWDEEVQVVSSNSYIFYADELISDQVRNEHGFLHLGDTSFMEDVTEGTIHTKIIELLSIHKYITEDLGYMSEDVSKVYAKLWGLDSTDSISKKNLRKIAEELVENGVRVV